MTILCMCMLELNVFLHYIKPYPPAVPGVPDPTLQHKISLLPLLSLVMHITCGIRPVSSYITNSKEGSHSQT